MNFPPRILHVDADNFFVSCETVLDASLCGRVVWVVGGGRGGGVVVAASAPAKLAGVRPGMPCSAALRLCPRGVFRPARLDVYKDFSRRMFAILREFSPLVVVASIDEAFLDFSAAPIEVEKIRARIFRELRLPVSAGLANSPRLAKFAANCAKPGFLEIPAGTERDFLALRFVRDLCGVGVQRERALSALGAVTFADVARLPSMLLKEKFGIWGQELWLFANGRWAEPLISKAKTRTMISRSKTFLADEKDFEKVLNFGLGEVLFLAEQLRREHLEAREMNVCVRFGDFSEVAATRRFRAPQREPDILGAVFGELFRGLLARRAAPVRQLRVALRGLSPRPPQRLLFE